MTSPYEPELPLLPYAGTSGWSGSEASHDRALAEDGDGTTTERQAAVIATLYAYGGQGATWKQLAGAKGWHHGQASGALSVLHKAGKIDRLRDERRHGCSVYVLPQFVDGRPTVAQGGRKSFALTDAEAEAARRLRAEVDRRTEHHTLALFRVAEVRALLEAVERAAR